MSPLSRRRLLAAAALGALPLSGCTWSSPVVRGGPPAPPPQPPPPPEVQDALRTEQTLAAVARALATGPDGARWTAVADAHAEHATALVLPDRTGPLPPEAGPVPDDLTGVPADEGAWRSAVEGARPRYRDAALAASGPEALLWASLSAFAAGVTGAGSVAAAAGRAGSGAAVPDGEAASELLTVLHAVVSGYALALVPLPGGSAADEAARARLDRLLGLRDTVTAVLGGRGLPVPAAAPDYAVDLDPRDEAASAVLRRDLELTLQPWLGRWVAAASDADRPGAVDALVECTTAAVGLGARLAVWPGWGRP